MKANPSRVWGYTKQRKAKQSKSKLKYAVNRGRQGRDEKESERERDIGANAPETMVRYPFRVREKYADRSRCNPHLQEEKVKR